MAVGQQVLGLVIQGLGKVVCAGRRRVRFVFFHAHGPVPVAQLVKVAGTRWKIEDGFTGGRELAAPDKRQFRSWTILALLAHASCPSWPPASPSTAVRTMTS